MARQACVNQENLRRGYELVLDVIYVKGQLKTTLICVFIVLLHLNHGICSQAWLK